MRTFGVEIREEEGSHSIGLWSLDELGFLLLRLNVMYTTGLVTERIRSKSIEECLLGKNQIGVSFFISHHATPFSILTLYYPPSFPSTVPSPLYLRPTHPPLPLPWFPTLSPPHSLVPSPCSSPRTPRHALCRSDSR